MKKEVIILGKGSSENQCEFDVETWVVNDTFGLINCKRLDRIFYFDKHFVGDWFEKGEGIIGFLKHKIHWVKQANYFRFGSLYQITPELLEKTGAIVTTFHKLDIKNYEEYPLKEILKEYGVEYFTDSVAYMVAFAIFKGYTKIKMRGCDYFWGDEIHSGKRDCVEFWLGVAKGKGIEVDVGKGGTLLRRKLLGVE